MNNYQITQIKSRFFDLDSQHHINSATYLSYAREGQFYYLHDLGYNKDYFINHKIFLKPELIHVKYFRQQMAHVNLEIHTKCYRIQNSINWDQKIYNQDSGDLSVHLTSLVAIKNHLLDKIEECYDDLPEPLLTWDIHGNFSNTCKRSVMDYRIRHIDLDGFNQCSDLVLWRINEEARWKFMEDIEIPFENLVKNDLSLFWINGIYHYYDNVKLNDELKIYTWISRIDKVRTYIRQEIIKNDGERVLRTEGEFLTVSLSRSKPVRIPDFLKSGILPYMEKDQ
ncbi:MAG: hypothetical protein OEV78_07260 [Spirochaetia bacterium]|nr:hypothetical protein [Spirochaetia bacterium]